MAIVTCCGCISLERGSLILGILNCLGYIFFLVQTIIKFTGLNQIDLKDETLKILYYLFKAGYSGMITFQIIMIAISIIFIIGIKMRNKKFILLYLVMTFAQLVNSIPAIIFGTIFISSINISGGLIFFIFIIFLLMLVLSLYFWMVVYYHYKTLTEERRGPTSHQYSV